MLAKIKKRTYLVGGLALLFCVMAGYLLIRLNLDNAVYYSLLWIAVGLVFLVLGNALITRMFDSHFPWLRFGKTRLFLHLILGIVYSLIIVNLAYLAFKSFFTQEDPTAEQLIVMNVYGLIIFVPSFCVYFSLYFLRHWQDSELAATNYKKERVTAELNALKNHLDPHFLFNNLNILSALIQQDQQKSIIYLDKFADVYRGLLQSKNEDLITVVEELELIQSYIYLLKTRFENNIHFVIEVDVQDMGKMMPPLTLQMLVENATKHNIISARRPLNINIKSDGNGHLRISNTVYRKPEDMKDSGGTGLDNIQKRFSHFTDKVLVIKETPEVFEVIVPLLKIEII